MKKIICGILLTSLTVLNCFAGTLRIREGSIGNHTFRNVEIECKYERSHEGITWFRKSDGKYVIVGPGQEWWYED